MDDSPWVIGGDFNAILWDHKSIGHNLAEASLISNFRDILDHCSLHDMGYLG